MPEAEAILEAPSVGQGLAKTNANALDAEANAGTLRAIMDAIKPLADEARVCFTPAGPVVLKVRTVDPAHVAMVSLEATAEAVLPTWPQGAPFEVGLDVGKLSERLKAFDAKEAVHVSIRENKLTLEHAGFARTVTLLDAGGMVDPKVPTVDLPALAEVPLKEFAKRLKDMGQVSDHVALTVEGSTLTVSAEGDADKDAWKCEGTARGEARSLYSLDYLQSIVKAAGAIAPEATLHIGTDYPLQLIVEGGGVKATYLLAPRVETDS